MAIDPSEGTQITIFAAGFAGFVAVELAQIYPRLAGGNKSLPAFYRSTLFWFVRLLTGVVSGALALAFGATDIRLAFVVGAFVPALFKSLAKPSELESRRDALEKVVKAEQAVEKTPDKARPYWDLSSARLELYFQRNLAQTGLIFWITTVVLIGGFGLICYGVLKAFSGAKIEAALISASAGVITEFIAATFLVLYKSTLTQATGFVHALEKINAVGMSLQIVDSIPGEAGELKSKTTAQLALKILEVFHEEKKGTGKEGKAKAKKSQESE